MVSLLLIVRKYITELKFEFSKEPNTVIFQTVYSYFVHYTIWTLDGDMCRH